MAADSQNTTRRVFGDQQLLLLYIAAAALRLLLAITFPGLPDFLSQRVEIATPVTGLKRCKASQIKDPYILHRY